MSRNTLSTVVEVAGLTAATVGVGGLAGLWWGLIAAGVAAVVYAVALTR
jgi:hypothetical protein